MTTRRRSGAAKPSNGVPTNQQIAALARKQKQHDTKAKAEAKARDDIKPKLVAMMKRAKTRLVESGGVRIVLSEPEKTVYDSDGIFIALPANKRKYAFDVRYNFSKLSAGRQKELHAAMIELLTTSERRRCEEHVFNLDRMSVAIQEGKIPIELLDDHTSVEPQTAYTTISFK